MPAPLKFAHAAHAKTSCESCHGDMRAVDLATTRQLPTMASCLTCHTDGARLSATARTVTSPRLGGLMETKFPHGELVPRRDRVSATSTARGFATRSPAASASRRRDVQRLPRPLGVRRVPSGRREADRLPSRRTTCSSTPIEAQARHSPIARRAIATQTFCVGCHERSGLGTRADTRFNSVDPQRSSIRRAGRRQGWGRTCTRASRGATSTRARRATARTTASRATARSRAR